MTQCPFSFTLDGSNDIGLQKMYPVTVRIFDINFNRIMTKSFHMNLKKQPPEMFCEKGVLRNFTKFTRKHLCQSLFFNKVAGPRPATLLKKRLWHRCLFSCEFCEISKNNFSYRTPLVAASELTRRDRCVYCSEYV